MTQAITTITPPLVTPVNVAELKTHLRLIGDDGSHDLMLGNLIAAATQVFERQTNTAIITRTLKVSLDGFPDTPDAIYLPMPPSIAVTKVEYLDDTGTMQTLDPSLYHTDTDHQPARVTPAHDEAWPTTRKLLGAVTVTYTAGHGEPDDVPQDITAAILMLASTYYEQPGAYTTLDLNAVPMAVETIIANRRMPRE